MPAFDHPSRWRLAALLLPGLAMPAMAADLIALDAAQQRAFGIQLAAPVATDAALTRRFPARVAVPNRQLRVVAAPQAGTIEALLVAEGERVTAGQVLARLTSPGLVDAESAFLETATRLELAAGELARDESLLAEGIIAERRLLEARSRQRELQTMLEQRRQMLEIAGRAPEEIEQLRRTHRMSSSLPVRAPISGVVLEQIVGAGESVAAAAPLFRIAEPDPLWVEAQVPVDRLDGIAPGQPTLLPGLDIAGTVITVGRMVQGQDQGVLVRAEVRDPDGRLRPGQFVEMQVATLPEGGALWRVPAAAVVRNAADAFVFAARPNGFAVVPVRVRAEEEQSAVVTGALTAQDRVAVSGAVALKAAWLAGAEAGADGAPGTN